MNTKPKPKFYYQRHMGGFRVYKHISENISESVDYHALEKDAKEQVYKLNGWTLKKT